MANDIGIVSATAGAVTPPVQPAVSSAAAPGFAAALTAASVATPIQNPRVVQDPTAGLITEYLSANGSQVVSQTPSAITVAYLHAGLTADGTAKSTRGSVA